MGIGIGVINGYTEYMVMSRDQNVGKIQNIKISNKYFEKVE